MTQEGYDYCKSRTEIPFQPKCFSGLNWQEAFPLVGKMVVVSNDGDKWAGPFILRRVFVDPVASRFQANWSWWTYIRTTPETYAHPTITISEVKLPRPETKTPQMGHKYWTWSPYSICMRTWEGTLMDEDHLKAWHIHLLESRAQEWADWWKNVVITDIKGEIT